MKKLFWVSIFAIVLSLALTVGVCDKADAAEKYGDYLYYEVSGDGQSVAITDCDTSATEVEIPNEINGLPVTCIGEDAFSGCGNLESVYITDVAAWCNINFENYAANPLYYADKLYINDRRAVNVVIPDGVKQIPMYAFSCDSLKSITISDSVKTIEDYAFYNCSSLSSITIGNGVTSIGKEAFYKCKSIATVNIPDNVISIGNKAFYNCSALVSVTIGKSVTSIGAQAFYYCSSLSEVNLNAKNAGDYTNKNKIFGECATSSNEIKVNYGNFVEHIPSYLFYSCALKIKSVTIGNGVKTIGEGAFASCINITDINLPDGIMSIGASAFSGCTGMTSITLPNSVTNIGNFAFQYSGITNITIPDNVTSIGDYAFYDCNSLISVRLPDGLKNIGYMMFFSCESLKNINIPYGVTNIGASAFQGCGNLTSVIIPGSVMTIEANAFYYCDGLISITIPESVTTIGDGAFQYCDGLTKIIVPESVTNLGKSVFYECDNLLSVTIPGSIKNIAALTFSECSSLKSITIPNGVKGIGGNAFYNCRNLENVIIPDTVYEIENYAFSGCTALSVVEYGGSETEWSEVYIGSNNDPILNAEIRFNSALASSPAENELTVKQVESESSSVYTFCVLPEKVASGCFVYAAAYSEEGDARKLIGISKTELLTDGETKINVNKDDGIDFVVMFVWRGENNPISQTGKVNIS